MSRIKARLSYANVMVTVLAFIVITGGGAVALGAQGNALSAGQWHVVGASGQPGFHATSECKWQNYDTVHSNAAFVRDSAGFVHVKGTVTAIDRTSQGSCHGFSADTNEVIFVLPLGFRPALREAMAGLTGPTSGAGANAPASVGTVAFDGPPLSLPAGAVSVDENELGGGVFFTLDGMSFRCAPSGRNGCP